MDGLSAESFVEGYLHLALYRLGFLSFINVSHVLAASCFASSVLNSKVGKDAGFFTAVFLLTGVHRRLRRCSSSYVDSQKRRCGLPPLPQLRPENSRVRLSDRKICSLLPTVRLDVVEKLRKEYVLPTLLELARVFVCRHNAELNLTKNQCP